MNSTSTALPPKTTLTPARDWLRLLTRYREPNMKRSILELVMTIVPFLALWVAAYWALSISYWLTLAISIPAGGFLVRFFLIQHDCGHGAFFRRRKVNDWVGRILGVFTLTPYQVWRRSHATHHATSGNLGKRGVGDIDTLTVREYRESSLTRRILYRLYRHPIVMFGLGPAYYFVLRNRLPLGFSTADKQFWFSAMGTNIAIALVFAVMFYLIGFGPFLMVQIPITLIASSIGVWLFYVQHQFEDTFWDEDRDWNMLDAALYGSSHFELPHVLQWITANIGVHHVHHLCSRIPYYRLPQVMRDFPELAEIRHITLKQSFSCLNLRLWDENQRKLISFADARELA